MTTLDKEQLQTEVDANYAAFADIPLKMSDKGKFALLHKCKLVSILNTHKECRELGRKEFSDGLYSIQEILPDFEEYLGYRDHTLPANRTTKTRTPAQNKLQAKVDANFEAFNKMSFKESNQGKFALLRDCKVITILDTHKECRLIGPKKFSDRFVFYSRNNAQDGVCRVYGLWIELKFHIVRKLGGFQG